MKKYIYSILGLLMAAAICSAAINPFTGYTEGTAWESYTDQQKKAGFLLGVKHIQIPLTAAQIIAMYTTPVQIVAAPGAAKSIAIEKIVFKIVRTSTAFTGGGAAIIQYDNTANGAGTQACDSTLASTVITGAAGTSLSLRNGAVVSDSTATVVNKGIFISNATAVFAAGTGTATVDIWYVVN